MKYITDVLCLYKKQLLNMLYAVIGCFTGGMLLIGILRRAFGDMTSFPVGTIMMFFGAIGMLLLYGAMLLVTKFDLQLSMGATRKQIVFQYAVFMLISIIILWLGGILCLHLEELVYGSIFKMPPESDTIYRVLGTITITIGPLYFVLAGMAVLVAAASLRWGRVVFWCFYAAFIIACQVPGLLNVKMKSKSVVAYEVFLNMIKDGSPLKWLYCIAIMAALSGLGWFLLRKQRVTL